MNKPNPGSEEALAQGCKCPVVDNHFGKGIPNEPDLPMFWRSADCSLHGVKNKE